MNLSTFFIFIPFPNVSITITPVIKESVGIIVGRSQLQASLDLFSNRPNMVWKRSRKNKIPDETNQSVANRFLH
jgi:hypothetical protein